MPFAVTGALVTLWLTGDTLNMMSMIGLILLMGLVKKNSIILVDYTNQLREANIPHLDSPPEGGRGTDAVSGARQPADSGSQCSARAGEGSPPAASSPPHEHLQRIEQAVLAACPVRLRPIIMTSVATVAGAIPAAIGLGPGAETRAPMARAIIGGIVLSTLVTLVLVPVFYVLVERLRKASGKLLTTPATPTGK
jgi:multidrug efflux pump subunit AcrB